jgi:hypothetical protein
MTITVYNGWSELYQGALGAPLTLALDSSGNGIAMFWDGGCDVLIE